MSKSPLSVIIHGGGGGGVLDRYLLKLPVMDQALDAAWAELSAGKPGEFAVAAALRVMEESEHFNAGYGGHPNEHGVVLLDAGIMRGNRDFAALMNVRRVKYPSAILMDRFPQGAASLSVWTHEDMTAVDEAPELQKRYGWVATNEELIPPSVKEMMRSKKELEVSDDRSNGTVGCVVSDASGEICAGTSTGGISFKGNGRIGDSPIVGAGVYADSELCGLSCTGHGESFMKSLISGFVIGEMRRAVKEKKTDEKSLQALLDREFKEFSRKAPGKSGAMILIPKGGTPIFGQNAPFVSVGMRWGSVDKVEQSDCFISQSDGKRFKATE